MRKLLLIFLFSIICFLSKSQTDYYFTSTEYSTWKVSGEAQCGIGNAYCYVSRSFGVNAYGNYTYYIYFASNSYHINCQYTRTYIPDIYIYYFQNGRYNLPINFFPFWITIGDTDLIYTLFHPNPHLALKVSVGKMEPTNY